MLYGIDVSHHNKLTAQKCKQVDFAIFKATEGKSWVDPKFYEYTNMFMANCKKTTQPLIGCYHFARPQNGNTPEQEANHFLNIVYNFVDNAILALDVEEGAENYPTWCCDWLEYVYNKTNVRPMLYTSQSNLRKLSTCYELNTGLWVAHYKDYGNGYPTVKPGVLIPWKHFAIWQWSNGDYKEYLDYPHIPTGFDANVFNGSPEAWLKYARGDNEYLPDECINCTKNCPRCK